jgi:hypothetical protein
MKMARKFCFFIMHANKRNCPFDEPEQHHSAHIKSETLNRPVFKAVEEVDERVKGHDPKLGIFLLNWRIGELADWRIPQ